MANQDQSPSGTPQMLLDDQLPASHMPASYTSTLSALTLPLFARGVFAAEFQLDDILEPIAGLIPPPEILLPLDAFARGGAARGFCRDQIADAYRRARLQVNTTEIDAAMDHALNLHEAGHWQVLFNFQISLPMAAPRVIPAEMLEAAAHGGAVSPSSEPTDPNAVAVAVAEAEEHLSVHRGWCCCVFGRDELED